MYEVYLYGHYGSGNHGNEAIVRGLKEILGKEIKINVFSMNIDKDFEYGLNSICSLYKTEMSMPRYSVINFFGGIQYRLIKKNSIRYRVYFKELVSNADSKLYIMEMGDQYCENSFVTDMYAWLNKEIHRRGGKVIALGGSINESQLNKQKIIDDLLRYDEIFVRESVSYEMLKKRGVSNVVIFPDPAFAMQPLKKQIKCLSSDKKIIGIVVGGVAQGNEEKTSNLIEEIVAFIEYILKESDYNVLLIPHVNAEGILNDVEYQKYILSKFESKERILRVPELRADELKYIISNCYMLITLRTHASIAAYSSYVPTIVLGYSVKSKGIAIDLFGTDKNYVVDIKSTDFAKELKEAFYFVEKNHDGIVKTLKDKMMLYNKSFIKLKEKIESVV